MKMKYAFIIEEKTDGIFKKSSVQVFELDVANPLAIASCIDKEFKHHRGDENYRLTVCPWFYESTSNDFFEESSSSKKRFINSLKTAKMGILRNRPFFEFSAKQVDSQNTLVLDNKKSSHWSCEIYVEEYTGNILNVLANDKIDLRIDLDWLDVETLVEHPGLLDDFVCSTIRERITAEEAKEKKLELEKISLSQARTNMWHACTGDSDKSRVSRLVFEPEGIVFTVWELAWASLENQTETICDYLKTQIESTYNDFDSQHMLEYLRDYANMIYIENGDSCAVGKTVNYIRLAPGFDQVENLIGLHEDVFDLMGAPASYNDLDCIFTWDGSQSEIKKEFDNLVDIGMNSPLLRRDVLRKLYKFPGHRYLDYYDEKASKMKNKVIGDIENTPLGFLKWQHHNWNSVWHLIENEIERSSTST